MITSPREPTPSPWVTTPFGRRVVFGFLYLSEGAPIGFIWWALPTVLRAAGHEVTGITRITAALALPWMLKFLWAPLVDICRGPRFGYRHWIIAAQVGMGLTFLPLIWIDAAAHTLALTILLIAHALCAATQDVAIDAWAISITPVSERGRLTGAMQTGMLIGRWLFGAGLLLVVDHLPPAVVITALVAVIWGTTVLVIINPYEVQRTADDESSVGAFISALVAAFTRSATWKGIAFALLAGAGFELVGGVAGPLLYDHGFPKSHVAIFFTISVVMMIAGASLGGLVIDRAGHRRGVAGALLTLCVAIVLLAIAASQHDLHHTLQSKWAVFALAELVYLGIGAFVASSYAYFMDLTDPRLGGTQFSTFMGATNGCEVWAVFVGGTLIVDRFSYPVAFIVLAAASVLALLLLPASQSTSRPAAG